MMERQRFSARRVALVVLLCLGSVALVSGASSELPLLPPVDAAQSGGRARSDSQSISAPTRVELLMIRLIRTFFGDQVKWSPFSRRDHSVHPNPHHRIVHEHRPHRPHLHSLELAKRRFRLRGKISSAASTSRAVKPQPQQQ